MNVDVPPAIAALLLELPPPGTVWPRKRREQWLTILAALMDWYWPPEEGSDV